MSETLHSQRQVDRVGYDVPGLIKRSHLSITRLQLTAVISQTSDVIAVDSHRGRSIHLRSRQRLLTVPSRGMHATIIERIITLRNAHGAHRRQTGKRTIKRSSYSRNFFASPLCVVYLKLLARAAPPQCILPPVLKYVFTIPLPFPFSAT